MLAFTEIKVDKINIAPEQVLLRSSDYQKYLAASELVEKAHTREKELDQRAKEVHERYRSLGRQAGMEEARISQAALIHETYLQCQNYYRQIEQEMSGVVLQAVRKILRDFDNYEVALRATREALLLANNQKNVTLRVEPDQVSGFRERILSSLKDYPEIHHIEVIADARLDQGGCILETEVGVVDASIEGQLMALKRALTQSFTPLK